MVQKNCIDQPGAQNLVEDFPKDRQKAICSLRAVFNTLKCHLPLSPGMQK